jgi:RNA polymerase sigma factor (sigma-70 family)
LEASVIHAPAGSRRSATGGKLLRLRSDDQLVALFRLGYDEAFGVIHDRYRARLLAYVRQMLSRSGLDAEDVLQDTFMRAYAALRNDDRPVTLRAWLYRVAHNRCIDHLRRPEPPMAEIFELQRPPSHDPHAASERRETLRRLVADVQRLPEQQRSALLMRELEGLSYAELADALDTTVPSVKALLVRARCGLLEAGEARDAACAEIRAELDDASGRGVRASARSRRHLRDCAPCREYRDAARKARRGFRALAPGEGPLAALAKILGLGSAGSVASVGGAGVATKVVAVVCCAAVLGGGAAVRDRAKPPPERAAAAHRAEARRAQKATLVAPVATAADPFRTIERAPVAPTPVAGPKPATAQHTPVHATPPQEEVAPIRSTTTEAPAPAPATSQQASDQATAEQTGGALAPPEDDTGTTTATTPSATTATPGPTATTPATPGG